MAKNRMGTKSKVILAVIALSAIAFGIYNLAWFQYIETRFNYLVEGTRLQQVKEQTHRKIDTGWMVNTYHDATVSGYTYTVAVPSYLEFTGNISVLTPSYVDEVEGGLIYTSKCILNLTIFPSKKNMCYRLET